jgi:hypothetical protein
VAFVNFWVYYQVPVPYADVFTIERFLHDGLSGRVPFPTQTRNRTRLSEWFDCTPQDLRFPSLVTSLQKGTLVSGRTSALWFPYRVSRSRLLRPRPSLCHRRWHGGAGVDACFKCG